MLQKCKKMNKEEKDFIKKDSAIALNEIDWFVIQTNVIPENSEDEENKLLRIKKQLLKLEKEEIVDLFFKVLEAERLSNEYLEIFLKLLNFEHV